LLQGLLPFFATRIIYAGQGKMGIEPQNSPVFQLSQRADFFTEDASVDTLYRRPLVNTRDEPHADACLWRRLHVICGDANMSEYATALKIGTTYLVTSLLETGWKPGLRLKNAVQAIKDISRDQTFRWLADSDERGTLSAVDIQRVYLSAAKEQLARRGTDTEWILTEWESTLDTLERNPLTLGHKLDWVAKRNLLTDYMEAENIGWNDETLPSFDLAYSNVDPDESLYYALEQAGDMVRLTTDAEINTAMTQAPENTRAAIRGALVSRFSENLGAIGWNKAVLRTESESWLVDLDNYLTPETVAPALARLNSAQSLPEFLQQLPGK